MIPESPYKCDCSFTEADVAAKQQNDMILTVWKVKADSQPGKEFVAGNITGMSDSSLKPAYENCLEN